MTALFTTAFIYLAAAVLIVPLSKRLGLGSVLGYASASARYSATCSPASSSVRPCIWSARKRTTCNTLPNLAW